MGDAIPATGPVPAWKWRVIWLLFLATVINYMDRQTFTSLSGPIKDAFTSDQSVAGLDNLFEAEPRPATGKRHLSEQGYGTIEFAFGVTYATFHFVAGYLVDRGNLRWFYAAALVLWSAAGFFTGLATTVEALIICRVVLAIGEAFNWPCAVTAVQRVMPREQRSLANGIFHSGASIGAIVTPLLVLAMIHKDGTGWQAVFLAVGGGGALWAVLWLVLLRGERAAVVNRRPEPEDGPATLGGPADESFWSLFTRRFIWITLAVSVAINICWHFCRVWLPRYLDRDLGFTFKGDDTILATVWLPWGTWAMTPADVGLLIQSGFYIAADVGSLLAGYCTRKLIYAGWPVERARQAVQLGAAGLCLAIVPAVMIGNVWVTVPLLFVAAAGSLGGFANYFALVQEVSARHTALILGFTGGMAWFIVAAIHPVAGRIADEMKTFVPLFIAVAFVPLAGALLGLLWPVRKA